MREHGERAEGGSLESQYREAKAERSEFEVSLGYQSRPHFNEEKLLEEKREEICPFLCVET